MEENNTGLTNMEEAKELFEYEMTAVLLNVRASYGKREKPPRPEYLDMEVPKTEVDFSKPDIELNGLEQSVPEASVSEGQFDLAKPAAESITVDKEAFGAVEKAEVRTEVSIAAADISGAAGAAKAAAENLRVVSAERLIAGAESAKAEVRSEGLPEVDIPKVSAPAGIPPQQVKSTVSVSIPEVSPDSFPKELSAETPTVSFDETAAAGIGKKISEYGVRKIELGPVKIGVPDGTVKFDAPQLSASAPDVPGYPEIPPMPDHAAALNDILASIAEDK